MQPTLRLYQTEVVRTVIREWFRGNPRMVLQLPTGSGKTVIAAEIVRRASTSRVLYVVPSEEIFEQTYEKLLNVGVKPTRLTAGLRPPLVKVQYLLAMAQTLHNRVKDGLFRDWDPTIVITDEAHRLLDQHYQTLSYFASARALALTATPVRLDGKGLAHVWPLLVQGPTLADLRKAGALVPVRTLELPLIDTAKLKVRNGDYDLGQLARAFENAHAPYLAALYWLQNAKERKTVAFCPSVKTSQTLAAALQTIGVRAAHLDGKSSGKQRERTLEALENGELDIVCNCGLFIEGLDVPSVSCILVCTSTMSMTKWLQMCGRGMRPAPGKTDLLVIDHGHCKRRLGDSSVDRDWTMGGMPL